MNYLDDMRPPEASGKAVRNAKGRNGELRSPLLCSVCAWGRKMPRVESEAYQVISVIKCIFGCWVVLGGIFKGDIYIGRGQWSMRDERNNRKEHMK